MMTKDRGTEQDEQRLSLGGWECEAPGAEAGCQTGIRLPCAPSCPSSPVGRGTGGSHGNSVHLSGLGRSKQAAPADISARVS